MSKKKKNKKNKKSIILIEVGIKIMFLTFSFTFRTKPKVASYGSLMLKIFSFTYIAVRAFFCVLVKLTYLYNYLASLLLVLLR